MIRRPLAPDHGARLRKAGKARDVAAGEIIMRSGDALDRFLYIEDGRFELCGTRRGKSASAKQALVPASSSARSPS